MRWYQQKTTWTALAGILGAVGGVATGVVDPITAVQSIVGCLGIIFLRQGVEKSGK